MARFFLFFVDKKKPILYFLGKILDHNKMIYVIYWDITSFRSFGHRKHHKNKKK